MQASYINLALNHTHSENCPPAKFFWKRWKKFVKIERKSTSVEMSVFLAFWKIQKIKLFFQSNQKKIVDRFDGLPYGLLVSQIDVVQAFKKFFLELVFSFLANWDFLKHLLVKTRSMLKIFNLELKNGSYQFLSNFFFVEKKKIERLVWLQILLRKVWSDQNLRKSGNMRPWENVEIWLFALVWGQHDVLKKLCRIS